MDLLNATRMQAGYTQGLEKDGRELLVVAVRGTFAIPKPGQQPLLAGEQLPLVMADTFTGQPGLSAPVYEADFAPRKRRCDVILNGSAYAPGGKPATRVQVGVKVGTIQKNFAVVGDRVWQSRRPTSPEGFTVKPIFYDHAFGGLDNFHSDPSKHSAYMPNPVGRGYHRELADKLVDGTPLPNTEEINQSVSQPDGTYRPMAFGAIGRGWEPRYKLAGTYDQKWIDEVFPFLPADFDGGYFQCAPPDQQMDYPRGEEEVSLFNLTPQGRTMFRLPKVDMPVVFFPKKGGKEKTEAVIDTFVIEPDANRFTLTWRVSRPLKKNMFEVTQVLVGKMSRGWWRARELGKTYYPSLAELTKSKKREAIEETAE